MKQFILIICFLTSYLGFSQVDESLLPRSFKQHLPKSITTLELQSPNIEKLRVEDSINDQSKIGPYRFGVQQNTNISLANNGDWYTLENGDRIWRMNIYSSGAQSLNFKLENFYLPKGATLHFYNEDKSDIQGAYTSVNNHESETLGTWIVRGDKVTVEYFEPEKVQNQGRFTITSAYHGYRTYGGIEKVLNSSGDCNLDVDCSVGDDWEEQKNLNKRAVGMMLTVGQFSGWCSGSLINNTANDGTPYFLTANHCITGSTPATIAVRFGWISPVAICAESANSVNGPTNMLVNGTTLRANSSDSDFALLEMNNSIPATWDRVFAGWNRTGETPVFVAGIHHPRGDVMKVCRDNSEVVQNMNAGAQTWEITSAGGGWEYGVTEPGSSGSPLFDNNGKIIGQLFGGRAACSGLSDNELLDYYGRFDVSWNGGGTNANRLSNWLDPLGAGTEILESNPPMNNYMYDVKVSSNVLNIECSDNITPTIVIRNLGSENVSSLFITYNIDGAMEQSLNWTGNLAQNEFEEIQLNDLTLSPGSHTLNINVTIPEIDDEYPLNNDTSRVFEILEPLNITSINFSITTDDYAQETTWEFKELNGPVIQSHTYNETVDDNTTFNYSFDLDNNTCYELVITDSANDGICCDYGLGSYTITDEAGNEIASGGEFRSIEAIRIRVGSLGNEDIEINDREISIVPNPSNTGVFSLNFEDLEKPMSYEVFNLNGQKIQEGTAVNSNTTIHLEKEPLGIYLLKLENGMSFKLIKN